MGENSTKGRHTYGPVPANFGAEVHIGNFTSIGVGCLFHGASNHRYDRASTFPFFELKTWKSQVPCNYSNGPITIGHDVWLGQDVVILSGKTIGNGAVVAANSVVVRDIAPYAIYGGNPVSLITYRFNRAQIDALERIAWWNWSDELIIERMPYFDGPVEIFIEMFDTHQEGKIGQG